jgi:glycosyltransferase involved in cell wall biosynthesis
MDARMQSPLVTIEMPTWKRRAMVCDAVRSGIAQTFRDWELIVVHDGSVDAVERLGEPRLRVLLCPRSANPAQLRNHGVPAGSGTYVGWA